MIRFGMMKSIEDAEAFIKDMKDSAEKERIKYHLKMGKPHKARIEKAIYKSYKDKVYCGHCGFELTEAHWNYCPNCGFRIKDGYHLGYMGEKE